MIRSISGMRTRAHFSLYRAKPPCTRLWKSHRPRPTTAPSVCRPISTLLRCQPPSRTPTEGDAAHIHSAAAEHSSTIDAAGAAVAHSDSSSFQGAASGHVNDQFHFADTNPGTLQSLELPSQAASHAAVEIPLATADNSAVSLPNNFNSPALPTAVEDANGGDAADIHSAAADHSLAINTAGATVADSDSSSFPGAASGDWMISSILRIRTRAHFSLLSYRAKPPRTRSVEIPPATTNNGAVSLSNNFNSPSPPTAADNLAPQAAKDPSLLSGTVSKRLCGH